MNPSGDQGEFSLDQGYERLEDLTHQLLDIKFHPWDWQLALVRLQQDAQGAARRLKAGTRGDMFTDDLWQLQHLRFQARILGDAFAWLMLGLDRPVLASLAENSPTPTPPEDDAGLRTTMVAAQALMDKGMGFPVLHDITDCLRIGDLTFVKPQGGKSRQLTTVELKSHLVSKVPIDEKTATYTYDILAVSYNAHARHAVKAVDANPSETTARRRRIRLDSRARRQFKRMEQANAKASAVGQGVVTLPSGVRHLVLVAPGPRKLDPRFMKSILEARENGHASFAADDATFVMTLYNSEEITKEQISGYSLPDEMVAAGFDGSDAEDNSLLMTTFPGHAEDHEPTAMPFLLLGFPRDVIIDFLRGRLMIVTFVLRWRLKKMLNAAGVELVSLDGGASFYGDSFILSRHIKNAGGESKVMELHHFGRDIRIMLAELAPVEAFVKRVSSAFDQMAGLADLVDTEPTDAPNG